MPRTLQWKDLKLGLAATGIIAGLVVFILLFASWGNLGGRRVTIYATTAEATGVIKGTEVWLAGQKAGQVKKVHFRPPTTGTQARLAIEMAILKKHLPLIRKDSEAELRPAGDLIGAPVVAITPGTPSSPSLAAGDTIFATAKAASQGITAQLAATGDDFKELGSNVSAIITSVDSAGSMATRQASRVKWSYLKDVPSLFRFLHKD